MQKQLRTPTNPASFRAAGIDLAEPTQADYDRFCEQMKASFPGAEGEFYGLPTFEEYQLAMKEGDHG